MNGDDIIRMAREAGIIGVTMWSKEQQLYVLRPELECFAYSAFVAGALAEREDIAEMVSNCSLRATPQGIAAAIRTRGQDV
jgi:hypothetical protein